MSSRAKIYLSRGFDGCSLAVRQSGIAIVVDALRASSTITTLFDHGVERILVTAGVDDALELSKTMTGAVLVGERGGEKLAGFHLGNSPIEVMASPRMDGQTAIFTSSNGAQRLAACSGADYTLVGTVSNATVLAEWTRKYAESIDTPVVLVAAGKYPDESYISPEDEASCTYLCMRIGLPIAEESQYHFDHWERELVLRGLEDIYRHSRHAQRLMEIGYSEDVFFCARPDTAQNLPAVTGPVLLGNRQVGVELRNILA
ncbi:MAG TPA: 2-phosphosulfolactate phosphatase [Armatimonadota bacterium]|nr:2-phosphosulfolactate phosphatase [Armatimonadota bacterium]